MLERLKVGWTIALVLIGLLASAVHANEDIVGCNGFVKGLLDSVEISKIEIRL